MKINNITLFFLIFIVIIELLKHNKNLLFILLNINIFIWFIFLIRSIYLKDKKKAMNDIHFYYSHLKMFVVQITVLLFIYIHRYNIKSIGLNKLIYYIIIVNIILIGISEIYCSYPLNHHSDKIKRVINGILIIILALKTPSYKSYGIFNNIYGFRGHLIWSITFFILLNNFYIGNTFFDVSNKLLLPVLFANLIPVITQFYGANWLLYRAIMLSVILTIFYINKDLLNNTMITTKIEKYYKKYEDHFIILGIVLTGILLVN